MHARHALKRNCRFSRRLRPFSPGFRLAGCFLLVGTATILAGTIAQGDLIWVANGVLLAYFLLAPRRLWPAYLCAGLLGHALGTALVHAPWQVNLLDTPLDVGEALLSASLLRRRSAQLPRFADRDYLLRFLGFAVIASPLLTGMLNAAAQAIWLHARFSGILFQWVATDSLGACVVTPACVAVFRTRLQHSSCSRWNWAYLLLVIAVAFALLCQAKLPLPFILYPILILVLLRFGLGWAAMTTLFVAAVGSWFTIHGQGPFASSIELSRLEPAVVLQLFIASAMFMLYSISVVLESLRATDRRLQEVVALHNLVMENSRDVIIIADFEGNRSFVSSAGTEWGGWFKEELMNHSSLELVHPEDRSRVAAAIQEMRSGSDGTLVECRVRKRDESFVWVEASLRTIRDPVTGLPTGILNSVREITERKLAQERLAEAYRAVEALAITDALTGLANRRHFEQCLANEWRRGLRERKPLSLLLIDADYFKTYNDTYGHLRGDNCLKQIAEAAQDVVTRPGDLVARFGGEEFAVVLPNTSSSGAIQMAHDICAAVRNRQLPHSLNPLGVVTVSVGCATLVPQLGQHAASLVDCADKALYQGKRSGRNRACNFEESEAEGAPGKEGSKLIAIKSA